jgi:hypothetical protein
MVFENGEKYSLSTAIWMFISCNLFSYRPIASFNILVETSDSTARAARWFAAATEMIDQSKKTYTTLSVATG